VHVKTYAESKTVKVSDGHVSGMVYIADDTQTLAVFFREEAKVVVRGLLRFLRETDSRPMPLEKP
jgi:hypothetical protein